MANKKIKKIKLGTADYDIQATETNVVLENDLMAYTNVGKITGATNTNPVKVASKGDNLRTVFTKVFGEQTDQDPSIIAASCTLTKSAQTAVTVSSGEIGTAVSAKDDVYITFTLSTTAGSAPYGYVYKNASGQFSTVTGSQNFYYSIKKQRSASSTNDSDYGDIKITLPADKTATVVSGQGTLKSSEKGAGSNTNNILYCSFNSSNKLQLKISLTAGEIKEKSQTRFDVVTAAVTFGPAQKENQLTAGSEIISFLTFKGAACETTSVKAHLTKADATASSSAYTIPAGSYYNYYAVTSSTIAPTAATTAGVTNMGTSTSVSSLSTTNNTYIWFIVKNKPTNEKIQQYAMSQWNNVNTTPANTTVENGSPGQITFTTTKGKTLTYYAYRTDMMTAATGQYRIN